MGSLRRLPMLSDEEICSRYVAGEGRTMLALRAKVSDQYVREVLARAGIELRNAVEGFKAARELRVRQGVRRRTRPSWPKVA